jgi:hypothetical protein
MSDIIFWGLTASPFQLKMQALADYAGASWQRWPDQASRLNALKTCPWPIHNSLIVSEG